MRALPKDASLFDCDRCLHVRMKCAAVREGTGLSESVTPRFVGVDGAGIESTKSRCVRSDVVIFPFDYVPRFHLQGWRVEFHILYDHVHDRWDVSIRNGAADISCRVGSNRLDIRR